MFIYGVVLMKESWVEIYKIFREIWIKELEIVMVVVVYLRKLILVELFVLVSFKDVFLKKFFFFYVYVK